MPLKVWPNKTRLQPSINLHAPNTAFILFIICSAALVHNVLPRRDGGSGEHCAVTEASYSILAPCNQDSNPGGRGFKIISGDHYTTSAPVKRMR